MVVVVVRILEAERVLDELVGGEQTLVETGDVVKFFSTLRGSDSENVGMC